jgi:TolB-like protein
VFRVGAAYVVVAWLLIQVAETIFPLFGFDETPARITVIILVIGFLPAVVFAWAFELTPEGLKKESEVDRSQSITPNTGKRLDRLIMVVLALALGYFAVDKFVFTPQRLAENLETVRQQAREEVRAEQLEEIESRSIAVLPFVNINSDDDNQLYTDGLTEDLLILFGKVSEIRTPSRNSVFQFKDSESDIASIASQLNVRFIVDGTVRRVGDSIRVTAQLVHAQTDTSLWTDAFDRSLEDIFDVQDEIVASVIRELGLRDTAAPPRTTKTSPEVYTLFLQARHLNRRPATENVEEAHRLLEQAVALDPNYAPAFAELAVSYLFKSRGSMSVAEAIPLMRKMANRALELDPDYALAHSRLALAALVDQPSDPALAAQHFKRALELEPTNRIVLSNVTWLLNNLHRTAEHLRLLEYLVATDPMDHAVRFNYSLELFENLKFDAVVEHMRVVDRLAPGLPNGNYILGMSLMFTGDAAAGREFIAEEKVERRRVSGLASINCALGWDDEAEPLLAPMRDPDWWTQANFEGAFMAGAALAFCGEVDQAYEALETHIENGGYVDDEHFPHDPRFENLHEDPRWLGLLEAYAASHPVHPGVQFQLPPLRYAAAGQNFSN